MIRSMWSFLEDTPSASDPLLVQRSVIRLAVVDVDDVESHLAEQLHGDALRELGTEAETLGVCVFLAEAAVVPKLDGLVSVSVVRPNEPLGLFNHTVRVPNAPLVGEAVIAVQVCAQVEFPAVLDLAAAVL